MLKVDPFSITPPYHETSMSSSLENIFAYVVAYTLLSIIWGFCVVSVVETQRAPE